MAKLRNFLLAALVIAGIAPASGQQFNRIPDNTVIGRIGTGTGSGPAQAVPVANLATLLGNHRYYVSPDDYGAKHDGATDDTAAIQAAISAAAATGTGVMLSNGGYCVQPLTISDTGGALIPSFFAGIPGGSSALLACNTSSSPTLTLRAFTTYGFVLENLRINSNHKHLNGLLVTGFQNGTVRNVQVYNANGSAFRFLGATGNNVQYSTFTNLLAFQNGGIGFDFETDNTCAPAICVAANAISGLRAQGNGSDGFYVDYATVECVTGCESESNNGYGINFSHTRTSTFTIHIEGNVTGGINATVNSAGLKFIGGRLIDSISSTLLSCTTCYVDSTDAASNRITWAGTFSSNSITSTGGIQIGTPGGGLMGVGTVNIASAYYINGALLNFSNLAGSVTNAQLATMAANTTKCNATAGTATPTDCTASTMRTNIGLGTAATQNTGTSGANVPLLNGVNTWSGTQTFNAVNAGADGSTLTVGAGGTGTTNAFLKLFGANASAHGAYIKFTKNDVAASGWFLGHASAIEASGTSNNLEIYNQNTTIRTIALDATTDAVAFGAAMSVTGILSANGGVNSPGVIVGATGITSTGPITFTPVVVNSLPTCNSGADGARAFVTNNATATSFGGAVTTGGSNHHPVYCDGSASAWKQG